ncbi:MAG: lipoprotein-releasing system permease protein, partial [Gammaproteobacteria bacterium]
VRKYGDNFSQAAYMSDWTRTNGHLYQDIQLIRTVVYIVLALVIAVACFNIVSALVMSVKEKSKEIAILKTIGATSSDIAAIFILKGLYHGLKGALIGTVIGVLLALYLSEIIAFIEVVLGTQVFSDDIYFTGSIPSKLNWIDVVITASLVIFISTIATLYPAKQAASVEPTANLH